MKNIYGVLTIAASLTLGCCDPGRGSDSTLNEAAGELRGDTFNSKKQKDADFVYDAVASDYNEIKLAEIAIQRSRTPDVKQVANQLLADHTASLNALKTLAQAKAISVPVEERDAAKRKLQNMAEKSGEEFDREWCQEMIDLHEDAIGKYEDRLRETEDNQLQTFIGKTLAVLQHHHEILKASDQKAAKKNG